MIAVRGRLQRESDMVHVVAHGLADLSVELAGGVSERAFPLPYGSGAVHQGSPTPDPRTTKSPKPRGICIPDLRIDTIKIKSRHFRRGNCARTSTEAVR